MCESVALSEASCLRCCVKLRLPSFKTVRFFRCLQCCHAEVQAELAESKGERARAVPADAANAADPPPEETGRCSPEAAKVTESLEALTASHRYFHVVGSAMSNFWLYQFIAVPVLARLYLPSRVRTRSRPSSFRSWSWRPCERSRMRCAAFPWPRKKGVAVLHGLHKGVLPSVVVDVWAL